MAEGAEDRPLPRDESQVGLAGRTLCGDDLGQETRESLRAYKPGELAEMKRPQGRLNVEHPVPGRRYLHPLYEKAHIFLTIEGDEAACGRPILLDELWWVDSGWADRLGELWLVEATDKDNQCKEFCTPHWERHRDDLAARKQSDIFTARERPGAIAARDVKIETMKAWQKFFEGFWGEPVELILEGR